ncbi:MAG: hypothetical protein ABIJ34_07155 [archaeon]
MTLKEDESEWFKKLDERTALLKREGHSPQRIIGNSGGVYNAALEYSRIIGSSIRSEFKSGILHHLGDIDSHMRSIRDGKPEKIDSVRHEVEEIKRLRGEEGNNLSFFQ